MTQLSLKLWLISSKCYLFLIQFGKVDLLVSTVGVAPLLMFVLRSCCRFYESGRDNEDCGKSKKTRSPLWFHLQDFPVINLSFSKIILSSSTCCCSRSRCCTSATSLTTWQMFWVSAPSTSPSSSSTSASKVCLGAIVQLTWSADERVAKIFFAFFFRSIFLWQIYRHH